MLASCATDGQAEILIRDSIPREYIVGIVAGDLEIAKIVSAMLKTYGIHNILVYISTDVLSTNWSFKVRKGIRPQESLFQS